MHNKKCLLISLCLITTAAHAATCPPPSLIKSATFTHAEIYDDSSDLWELISAPFMYDNKQWNISYGLYIENAANAAEAIKQGQIRFQSDNIINQNPPADPIPGYLFCDYTESGMVYWIQAMTPPGK